MSTRIARVVTQTLVELDNANEELQSTLDEFKKTNRLARINPFKPILKNPKLIIGSQALLLRSFCVTHLCDNNHCRG